MIRTLGKILFSPSPRIGDNYSGKHASLISQMTFFLTVSIFTGIFYMGKYSTNPSVAGNLLLGEGGFLISYLISRTRFYKSGAVLCISILCLLPLLNVYLSQDRSSSALTVLLIWNVLTILFSSALLPIGMTIFYSLVNVLCILSFPLFLKDISLDDIAVILIFNTVIPAAIVILSRHRAVLEEENIREILSINARLQSELEKRNRIQDDLVYTASHDSLTNLPNRIILINRIQHAIETMKRHRDRTFGAVFIDLDKFKSINDTFGHQFGDTYLIEIGKRLRETVREQDLVARLGGDEFLVLLEEISDISEVMRIITRLSSSIRTPLNIDGTIIHPSSSFGIYIGNGTDSSPADIIRYADIAMYRAKKDPESNYAFFDQGMLTQVKNRMELESDLRSALDRDELRVFYQPILDTESREMAGFEALIRWNHPEKGMISPQEFIPVAEKSELIIPMGYWVLRRVCQQIREWVDRYPERDYFYVSINLSPRQLFDKGLVLKMRSIMEEYRINPAMLRFELTESSIIEDSKNVKDILDQIREMGCRILIDDFGTGYSSLSYLHNLPINMLKVDKSFIDQLSSEKINIVHTIIRLAHNLNMKVIAEGIEWDYQLDLLNHMDCDFVQGYLFSEPLIPEEAESFFEIKIKES